MRDQAQRLRELALENDNAPKQSADESAVGNSGSPTRSLAIVSGKGGVGKTNIALMLSIALSALHKKVLLFDADLGLANVHIMLGIAPKWNLAHVVDGRCSMKDIICEGPAGIDLAPGASGMEAMANLAPARMAALRRSLCSLEHKYDYLLIDTAAGIGTATTAFALAADMSICVMTPEPASLADAYAMIKVLTEQPTSRIGVIVNMAADEKDGRNAFDRLDALVVKFLQRHVGLLGILPADPLVGALARRQKILSLEKPGALLAARLTGVARGLCGFPRSKIPAPFFARVLGKWKIA